MKTLITLLVFVCAASFVNAQQSVYMNDGKQVMLFDNGTWKYTAQNNSNQNQQEDKNIQRAGYVKGGSTSNTQTETVVYNSKGEKILLKGDGTWELYDKRDSGVTPK